jgi:(4S)-4-hydroxy-5-phosphonooxypentane-2,3-dione isomerase
MIVTIVYVHVKPAHIHNFIQACITNHENAILEPGNRRFDFLQEESDASRFVLYEAYDSWEFAAAHKSTAHYLACRDAVESFMEDPRKGVKYRALAPTNLKQV